MQVQHSRVGTASTLQDFSMSYTYGERQRSRTWYWLALAAVPCTRTVPPIQRRSAARKASHGEKVSLQPDTLDRLRDAGLLSSIPARVDAALVHRTLRGDLLLRLLVFLPLLDARVAHGLGAFRGQALVLEDRTRE